MDVRYINPFIEGIKNVFSTMLETDIIISKPYVKTDDDQAADVSAIIGLSGDAVGSVALRFPMKTAVRVAGKFAGEEMSKDDENFTDALGELANMVTGQAKSKLDGLSCSISLPSVVVGKGHVMSASKVTPSLALPCDSTLGRFCVEIMLTVAKREEQAQSCEVA